MTSNRRLSPLLPSFLLFWSTTQVPAATTGRTNQAILSYVPPSISVESPEIFDSFKDRLFQEITSSDSFVYDRFSGPASRLAWAQKQDTFGYSAIEHFNDVGAKMFSTIALDSLRTAAIEVLPFALWQDYWQGRLANFVSGTIGNPQEEHVDFASTSYSAIRSSWEVLNERGGMQWGVRPWRTTPYLYFLAHAGRLDGHPLITFEGRGGYTLFGSTKIESRLAFQLPASFRIAGGASFEPTRGHSSDSDPGRVAVTLERVMASRGAIPASVFYVGFRSGLKAASSNARHENMLVAGLSRAW